MLYYLKDLGCYLFSSKIDEWSMTAELVLEGFDFDEAQCKARQMVKERKERKKQESFERVRSRLNRRR